MALQFKQDITFGCDIGVLFVKKGKVELGKDILADKKLPEDYDDKGYLFIPRGDQTKVSVMTSTCRAMTGDEIQYALRNLRKIAHDKGAKVYMEPIKGVNPSSSISLVFAPKREMQDVTLIALRDSKRMIPMLDILLGNTSVLLGGGNAKNAIDRGYRLEKFGVKYILPNFWYKTYQMASFAMGLGRLAVNLVAQSTSQKDYVKEFMSAVDMNDIRKAIRENDATLALANFRKVESLILALTGTNDENYPLTIRNIADFNYFLEKGMNHWFKRWTFISAYSGWENFLTQKVGRERRRQLHPKVGD